jgi:hypothetical protein
MLDVGIQAALHPAIVVKQIVCNRVAVAHPYELSGCAVTRFVYSLVNLSHDPDSTLRVVVTGLMVNMKTVQSPGGAAVLNKQLYPAVGAVTEDMTPMPRMI